MKSPLRSILIILMLATAAFAHEGGNATTGPTDRNLRYIGRWDRVDSANYHGNWIGSYVRTGFTGTSVSVKLGGRTDLDFRIDDGPMQTASGGPGMLVLNVAPLDARAHTLLVGCKGGGGWDFQGLALDSGAETTPVAARPIMEFIGDSITCGSPAPIAAAGNYTWLTAEALGCDHTQISWPGRALTTGYGCQEDKVGLDIQYFQQNCFYDEPKAAWDSTTYMPKMVVINLGQNDQCGNEPAGVFTESYISFLSNIRAQFPSARLVAMRPLSGAYAESVRHAVAAINERGDGGVHFIDTTGWLAAEDFSDGVHPNEMGNTKISERLQPVLKDWLEAPDVKVVTPAKEVATIGEPAKPGGLSGELQEAYKSGAREITIRPGTYNIPASKEPVFLLKAWQYATIILADCTMIVEGKSDIFDLQNCQHVTLRGPVTLRHSAPCGTQGKIVEVGRNPDGRIWSDWQVDAGYGRDTKGFDNFSVVTNGTRKLERCDLRNFQIEPLGEGKFRITWLNANDAPKRAGDWLIHRYIAPGCAVRVSNSSNCTIDGVTSQNGGHATFFEADGSGGNHYLNCGISSGPKPPGATEENLVANWADGLHSIGAFPGPEIRNFTDSGILLDDCIAIRGSFSKVVGCDPAARKITLDRAESWLIKVGEPVRVVGGDFYGQANVVSMQVRDGKAEMILDRPLEAPTGADCANPLRCGAYYKILNSHIGGTRSRGIIAKGDGGLIRNNTIADCGWGILLGPGGGEAGYFQDATVLDNTVRDCRGLGMSFESNGHIALRGIRIFRNRFEANMGGWDGDLLLHWLDGAVVSGNIFTGPVAWERKPRSPILIEKSKNVRITGNEITTPNGYAQPLLRIGEVVEKLTQDIAP